MANDVLQQCMEDGELSQSKCEQAAIKQANAVVGNMANMKRINIKVNAEGKVRREKVNGREYLVAPVVAVKEGVLNYDDGAEFIPAEEIKGSVDWWNGVDLPVGHPKKRGQPVSARQKDVVENNVVGRLWNARYENKKLKGELWVDVDKANNMGSTAEEVVELLENEEPIDVSTAYSRQAESSSGEYDGESYDRIQRNIRPDHLALLPHSTGNMSWSDGVGTPRLNEAGDYMKVNVRSTARTPTYSDTSTGEWSKPNLGDYGYDSVNEIPSDASPHPAEHTFLGLKDGDTWNEVYVLPIVDENGTLYKNALVNAKARVGQVSGISSDTVDSVKSKADQLLEDEFEVENEEEVQNIGEKVIDFIQNHFRGETMSDELETLVDNTGFEPEDFDDLTNEQINEWAKAYNSSPDEEPDDEPEEVENEEPDEEPEETEESSELEETVENQAETIEEYEDRINELEEKIDELKSNYAGRGLPDAPEDEDVASEKMNEFQQV